MTNGVFFSRCLPLLSNGHPSCIECRPRRRAVDFQICRIAGFQPADTSPLPKPRDCGRSADWKSAIGSLAPARLALRALPSLCSGNPFRRLPDGSSQQVGNLRHVQRRANGYAADLSSGKERTVFPRSTTSGTSGGVVPPGRMLRLYGRRDARRYAKHAWNPGVRRRCLYGPASDVPRPVYGTKFAGF